jgi:hypothetical protein
VFAALPMIEDVTLRDALVTQALTRLDDEDFGLDNEHAAMLGAAGDWSRGWTKALGERSIYPRTQLLAHMAPVMPEAMRAEAYERWLAAYGEAAHDSMLQLRVPGGLPPSVCEDLLAVVRSHPRDRAIARPLIALAYESPAWRPEAMRAVRALGGAHGALARLALIPSLDAPDQHALAAESYLESLALIDAQHGDELSKNLQYWNRGPEDRQWSYIPRHREPAALLVDTLAWMPPDQRARRVRELFARFRRIDDHGAIVTSAVAAVEHTPAAVHASWLSRLLRRSGPDEQDAHALAALARLADRCADPRRTELAAAAWRGRIEPGDREAGGALAVAAGYLEPAPRTAAQCAALTRWDDLASHGYQWTELLRGARDGLTPQAAEHALQISHRSSMHAYTLVAVLPALPAELREREATSCFEALCTRMMWWQQANLLMALAPHAAGIGAVLCAAIDRESQWPSYEPEQLAWTLAPLCANGHVERARALRAELAGDRVAACLADLAIAAFAPALDHREDLLAHALATLAELAADPPEASRRHPTTTVLKAFDLALHWLVPLGRVHQVIGAADRLSAGPWLEFAGILQRHGLDDELRALLTPARMALVDRGNLLLDRKLAAECWSRLLPSGRASELWVSAWQGRGTLAPTRAETARALVGWLPLALRAGDATTPERLAELILEIGDWFP